LLLGNKYDDKENQALTEDEILEWCNDQKKLNTLAMKPFFVSAKTGENLDKAFEALATKLWESEFF